MPAQIVFFTESEDAAEQFVREYVMEAIDQVPEIDGCEGIAFSLNEAPNPDGGTVIMQAAGNADAFLSAEEPVWDEYKEAGILQEWTVERVPTGQHEETFGDQGGDLSRRLVLLADRMAALVYEEFDDLDDLPAPYDTYPEEPTTVGWWAVPHHIAYASLDYSAAEEIQMHKAGIEEDLKLIAEFEGEDAVDAHLDSLLADLEDMREEVKAGRTRFQTE